MRHACLPLLLGLTGAAAFSATFGTVVPSQAAASYSDILLDEPRQRLYLVNSTANRIEVWSTQQRQYLASIRTDTQPVSIALSPNNNLLYVTAYTSSSLNIIDLTKTAPAVSGRIGLPASPEGVAVGKDGRVLITTVGSNGQNALLIYDPQGSTLNSTLNNVAIAPAAPTPPILPAPSGRAYLSYHSKLITTKAGDLIIGANLSSNASTNNRVVFVYEVASGTVLRSRILTNLSNVLSVSPDGSKFMAGYSLIDTATLAILAQENVANSPFAFPAGTQFNAQANQGGSVFSPDGQNLFGAFNFAPIQNPAARPNVTRLLYNDPDNLLIKLGLQLPENLSGRMVITNAGDIIYALSESGFVILPVGQATLSPIAEVDSQIVLLTNDQCGVTAAQSSLKDNVTNTGRGRLTATAQSYTLTSGGLASTTGLPGLGGNGGPGGGIIFPGFGGGIIVIGGNNGNTGTATPTTNTSTAPSVQSTPSATGGALTFRFNPNAAKSPGTSAPNDFLVQSNEAINIPANVRVFQNNRDADARGTILPVAQNVSGGETLTDLIQDPARQKLYMANSGLNQIEVFDLKTQRFTTPIKVGQLPHSLAIGTDGVTMYVANTGGESISIVDLDKARVTGRVVFPPIPANIAVGLNYPTSIASSQRGPQFVMSDGTLWKIDGAQAVPRVLNPSVFGGSNTAAVRAVGGGNPSVRTLAATPGGEYVLLVTGAGNAYLYDAAVDDYTVNKQIFSTTTLTGFLGPVAAGPRGQYYVANNTLLNSSLTPVATPDSVGAVGGGVLPGGGATAATATSRPVSAVAAIGTTTFARFTQPVRTGATSTATDAGMIEIVDANTGQLLRSAPSLESAASSVSGTQRIAVNGRGLVVDSTATNAYALTATGLSIIPLTPVAASDRPVVPQNGVVNLASYQATAAPGGLVSIFGQNLAAQQTNSGAALPMVLGGACVTLNNQALPLISTSPNQINAQLPIGLAAGRYPLVVRSISKQAASVVPVTVTVTKYAPAIFVSGSQAAIVHKDGSYVTKQHPTTRDQQLTIFATGLGPTHGGGVTSGNPAPARPLAITDPVQVYFGDPRYSQSAIIVEFSGLVPGFIGLNQINVRVPGTHMKGDALPVTIKIGGVSSPVTGPVIPTVAVE
ncbi:MAG: hypothetical protein M3Z09_14070 [Acidobacteriota bacterium]|nr:hypothetical protein [Acidobacteriota bacterium]